jgi:cell division protein FtsW
MVVTAMMPNTSVGLPFISYGGSSALFLMTEMGMVFRVAKDNAQTDV